MVHREKRSVSEHRDRLYHWKSIAIFTGLFKTFKLSNVVLHEESFLNFCHTAV